MKAAAGPVYLAVGANLDPEENILRALALLREAAPVRRTSTFYRTPALGRPEQGDYLNGIWQVTTELEPRALKFSLLRRIEAELGRVRGTDRYAARPIDLDIALYGDLVLAGEDLQIPDPEIPLRPFLALPLLELDPDLILPDSGESLAALVARRGWPEPARAESFTRRVQTRMVP